MSGIRLTNTAINLPPYSDGSAFFGNRLIEFNAPISKTKVLNTSSSQGSDYYSAGALTSDNMTALMEAGYSTFVRTPAAAETMTLPTPSQMAKIFPTMLAGSTLRYHVVNASTTTGATITVTPAGTTEGPSSYHTVVVPVSSSTKLSGADFGLYFKTGCNTASSPQAYEYQVISYSPSS